MEEQVYRLFAEIQTTHWWFVARRLILEDVLRRCVPPASTLRIADVGCGTGALLPMLAQFGEAWGVDDSTTAVEMCRQKNLANVYLDRDPAWRRVQFDVMMFLDVIEHVDDDAGFLKNYTAQLKPAGLVFITVPALKFLWSDHDRVNHHRRRYSAQQLLKVVERASLAPLRITYFSAWLFPFIALVRLANRLMQALRQNTEGDRSRPLRTDFERNLPALNGLLKTIFASERFVLRHTSFPIGTSLLCIARKPQSAPKPIHRAAMDYFHE